MLVRAVFHGVNFHQPVPPGTNDVEIEVFDPTQDAKTISVPTHIVIFQPNGREAHRWRRIFGDEQRESEASVFSRGREF